MNRKPKGYFGLGHQVVGAQIQSVLESIPQSEQVFDAELTAGLRGVISDGWYPVHWFLLLLEVIEHRLGPLGLMEAGRHLYRSGQRGQAVAPSSAADVLYAYDGGYLKTNRGQLIGGFRVTHFGPGLACLEMTAPLPCKLAEGALLEGLSTIGIRALIGQQRCFRRSDDSCSFSISSSIDDHRWGEQKPSFALLGGALRS